MTSKKNNTELKEKIQSLKMEVRVYKKKLENMEKTNAKLHQQLEKKIKRQKNLIYNDEKYRQIIDSIQEGYFEADLHGRITFCNKALLEISGYPEDVLIGKIFSDVTPPRTARIMQSVFGKVYKTGMDTKVDHCEVFHNSGHTLFIEFTAALMKDQSGRPCGFRGVLRDISKQVKATEKERRVRRQLHQAQKMEALGTLAGGMAHGFNNVLMAIQGNLSIIRMNPPQNPSVQKQLNRIDKSTEKGGRLAKEILNFAKMGQYVVMPTNLNKIVRGTSRMFLKSHSRLKIHEIYEKNLKETRVDRVQIGQVLLSLYMNAAEAMPEGGDLYLQSENVYLDKGYTQPYACPPGWYVKLSVTDDGHGLDSEAKRRIFEPFFSPYTPIRYEGLGLAAVYGTIKSHKGIINVYSEKGHGTTFNIYLPALKKETPSVPVEMNNHNTNATVMIVDDDPLTSQIGREILEQQGYRIMMAENGREAIEIYAEYKDKIHLVVLDVIMPDMNGNQVFPELKRHNPDVRVIVVSGYNLNRQITSLLDSGCVGFVQKPFQTQTLSSKVRMALNQDVGQQELVGFMS